MGKKAVASAERNEYIDFLRGIAAIGIVAIHTAFWSGQGYTPQWFWNITLLLDVPFFYYLSGWASSYRPTDITKTIRSLGRIWVKWCVCILILELVCLLSNLTPVHLAGVADIRDLVNNFFFNVSFSVFPVVAGSIWFMPIYFVVILGNTLVMVLIQKSSRYKEYKKIYLIMLAVLFGWVYYGQYFLGVDASQFLFYSFFWMLGQNRIGKTGTWKNLARYIFFICAGVVFTSYLQNLPIYDIQSAKFPPSYKYGFVSVIVILIIKYFEPKVKKCNRFLVHVGSNAIFYFFAQGIGSSLIYYYVNAVQTEFWFAKWIGAYTLNLMITITTAECLSVIYRIIAKKGRSLEISGKFIDCK